MTIQYIIVGFFCSLLTTALHSCFACCHAQETPPAANFGKTGLRAMEKHLFDFGFQFAIQSSVEYSPDGRYLAATATRDKSVVMIWECGSGDAKLRVVYDDLHISGTRFSSDGKYLAIGGTEIAKPDVFWKKVLEVPSGKENPSIKVGPQLTFYHGESEIAVISSNLPEGANLVNYVKVLSTKDDRVIREFKYEGNLALLSPDKKILAANMLREKAVQLWSVEKGEKMSKLVGHERGVSKMIFSPKSTWLATKSLLVDKTLRIWNTKTGELTHKIEGGGSPFAFRHDEKWLAVGVSPDGNEDIGFIDITTGKKIQTLKNSSGERGVSSAAFHPEGRYFAATNGRYVHVWELTTTKKANK
jgi:WD40 repeat protein